MLSDNQHIDDFFRQKEEAFAPDNLPVATHWQQLKTQLPEPGDGSDKRSPGNKNITRLLGLLVVAAVVLLVAINPFGHGKKKTTVITQQQTAVAVRETNATPKPVMSIQADSSGKVIRGEHTAKVQVRQPGPILISSIPAAPVVSNKAIDSAESIQPDAAALLQQFFQQLEKPAQEFYINANRDTTLIAREGTQLIIPANSLLTKAAPAKGAVKIIIREYYRYEDIVAAKLTTTSNGEQLETGGMLHISAEQDGEPVTIASQKAITVSIPTNNYDKDMQLFTGQEQPGEIKNNATLNWLAVGPLLHWEDAEKRWIKVFNLDKVEPYSVSYGKKTTARFLLAHNITIPKEELTTRLQQRFGSYYDVIKIKRARRSLIASSSNGKPFLIDSTFEDDTTKLIVPGKFTQPDSLRYVDEQDSIYFAKQTGLNNTYRFALSSFGWFNCDKFSKDPRPKVNYTLILKEATVGNHVSLLVFTRYRSVIQSGYWGGQKDVFSELPLGERAVVVTIAVTSDQVVANLHPITISDTVVSDLSFEPITPEQFKQKLQSLLASSKQP